MDKEIKRNVKFQNEESPASDYTKLQKNGKIIGITTIDYQFVSYGNIINDFMIFIFCSTDRKFRSKSLNWSKHVYHQELTKHLNFYNIDVNEVYPFDVFEKEFKDRLEFGLLSGFIYMPMSLGPKGSSSFHAVRNLRSQIYELVHSSGFHDVRKLRSQVYIDRINGLVEDFVDWGYL